MRTILLASILVALALPANAAHCETYQTSSPEVDVGGAGGTPRVYVDNDPCQPKCGPSIWVYLESNGIDGLQRGDEVYDDTCHGLIAADTIIF